jgi:hypothetical protein
MRHREQLRPEGGAAGEISARSADDARYGADIAVLEWKERLVCSQCGSRKVDMVVSGTSRR